MKISLVALSIHMYYLLSEKQMQELMDDINSTLLGLGSSWWTEHLAEVVEILINQYKDNNAAQAVIGFVDCYSHLI